MTKTVVITGASRGIGKALAEKLAALGIKVVAIARNEQQLLDLQKTNPNNIHIIATDISTEQGRQIISKYLQQHEKIDCLVNNAAIISPIANLNEVYHADFNNVINTNVGAVIFLSNLLIPYLKVDNGRILNITSAAAFLPTPGIGLYNISKAALDMVTQLQQMEFKQFNIAVSSVIPGEVATDIQVELQQTNHPAIAKQFNDSREKGVLMPVETCAEFLSWLLLKTTNDTFSSKQWTIYDEQHHMHWLQKGMPLPLPIVAGQNTVSSKIRADSANKTEKSGNLITQDNEKFRFLNSQNITSTGVLSEQQSHTIDPSNP